MGKSRKDLPPKDPELRKLWFELRQRRATLTLLAFGAKKGVLFRKKRGSRALGGEGQ